MVIYSVFGLQTRRNHWDCSSINWTYLSLDHPGMYQGVVDINWKGSNDCIHLEPGCKGNLSAPDVFHKRKGQEGGREEWEKLVYIVEYKSSWCFIMHIFTCCVPLLCSCHLIAYICFSVSITVSYPHLTGC